MEDSYWERKWREKFSFLYPDGQFPTSYLFILLPLAVLAGYVAGTISISNTNITQSGSQSASTSTKEVMTDEPAEQLNESLPMSSTDFMLYEGQDLFTYKDFDKNLNETHPYYEPDGATYKENLYNLLEEKDKKVIAMSGDLVKDVEAVISKNDPNSVCCYGQEHFLTLFAKLQKVWKPYRDALCEADLAIPGGGGSGQSGFILECKLYETEKYIIRLVNYRSSWAR